MPSLNENRLEPPVQPVSDPTGAPVKRLGINTVAVARTLRPVRLRRLHPEVVRGGHLAVGVGPPVDAGTDRFQHHQPALPVLIVAEKGRPASSPRRDRLEPARELAAKGSCQASQGRTWGLEYMT